MNIKQKKNAAEKIKKVLKWQDNFFAVTGHKFEDFCCCCLLKFTKQGLKLKDTNKNKIKKGKIFMEKFFEAKFLINPLFLIRATASQPALHSHPHFLEQQPKLYYFIYKNS